MISCRDKCFCTARHSAQRRKKNLEKGKRDVADVAISRGGALTPRFPWGAGRERGVPRKDRKLYLSWRVLSPECTSFEREDDADAAAFSSASLVS